MVCSLLFHWRRLSLGTFGRSSFPLSRLWSRLCSATVKHASTHNFTLREIKLLFISPPLVLVCDDCSPLAVFLFTEAGGSRVVSYPIINYSNVVTSILNWLPTTLSAQLLHCLVFQLIKTDTSLGPQNRIEK
jgi:hypothetical protein